MPLTPDTPIDTWIKDFEDSDNPKFAGKSKEERRKMAIGAFYGAKKQVKESLEEALNEARVKEYSHEVKIIHTGEDGKPTITTQKFLTKHREDAEQMANSWAKREGLKNHTVVAKPSEYSAINKKHYQVDFSHEKSGFFGGKKRVEDSITLRATSSPHARSKFEDLAKEGKLVNHKVHRVFQKRD